MSQHETPPLISESDSLFQRLFNTAKNKPSVLMQIAHQPKTWFPLTIILLATLLAHLWYFQHVDFDWFISSMIEPGLSDMTPAQQDEMRNIMSQTTSSMFMIAAILKTLITLVIFSLYLWFISSIRDDQLNFFHCFTLVTWSNWVMIFSLTLGAIIILLSSNDQIPYETLNGFNLNTLMFQKTPSHPWYPILSIIDFTLLWTLAITAHFYRAWTKSSISASYLISFFPLMFYLTFSMFSM